ncbi:MAG: DUF4268 domain-containing protein [Bacteroidales bacterium]|jgi:hypothetical protein
MYTKEESKKIKMEFWSTFKEYSKKNKKKKWIMQDTGINKVNLKFEFDTEKARVGYDIYAYDVETRIYYYEKFESLKSILEEALQQPLIWDLEYPITPKKDMAKIYLEITNVNILDKKTWNTVIDFFFKKMTILENIFLEYYDFIKYKPDYGTN